MNQIVIVGDVHEGINFDIRVDPQTGVSERALDMHRNLTEAASYAVRNKASLFVMLGDLFDRTHVAPIFREYVRKDVIEPLAGAGIKVYILAGNHDQPREFRRGTSIDDFRGYSNVHIFRKPECRIESIGGKQICFLIMPFLYPDSLIGQAGRELAGISEAQQQEVGRQIVRELLQEYSKQKADSRILLAHYYFEGADLSSTVSPEVEPGEIEFNASMIPEGVTLSVFGHGRPANSGIVILDAGTLHGYANQEIATTVEKTFTRYRLVNIIAVVILRSYKFFKMEKESEAIMLPNPNYNGRIPIHKLNGIMSFSRTRRLLPQNESPKILNGVSS